MAKKIYQVKISLNGSKPKVWRRLLISSDVLLPDFHKIIQTAMGWTNSHLHQFIKDRIFYTLKTPDNDMWDDLENVDYRKIKISALLKSEKDKVLYEYDFGDGWEHDIVLEKIMPVDEKIQVPVCLAGKMNCPPEDCGGVWGYADLLEILKNPKHKEYESYMEWMGGEFSPEYFDKEEVNKLLVEKDFGCFRF